MSERELPRAREFPRPVTPGPWGVMVEKGLILRPTPSGTHTVASVRYDDLRDLYAFAALPEWIEDRDRWKARAEQAEAALAEVRALASAMSIASAHLTSASSWSEPPVVRDLFSIVGRDAA